MYEKKDSLMSNLIIVVIISYTWYGIIVQPAPASLSCCLG